MKTLPAESPYEQLVQKLKEQIAEGIARAQEAYEREKILTYWKMGESISKHLLSNARAENYGKELFNNLSQDLDISKRLLYQMTQFYNAYLAFSPLQNITWSHYRLLSTIRDETKRAYFENQIALEDWTKRDLENALRSEKKKIAKSAQKKKLSVFREKLFIYQIFKDPCSVNLLIDLGFKVYKETELFEHKGTFVETVKISDEKYEYNEVRAKRKQLYVYKAFVTEVIDGDTFWVMIDLGFKNWIKQKIRLRGIDTPAIETLEGIKAKEYVVNSLKDTKFIVIKCHYRDKFDRYLSDVFYLEDEEDPQIVLKNGNFINQELLDNNMAIPTD